MKKQISLFLLTVSTVIIVFAAGIVTSSAAEKLPSPGNFILNTIDDSVEITWDEAPNAAKYELFYQQKGTGWQSVFTDSTKHTFTDVSPYDTYFFQIRAIDEKDNPGKFSPVNKREPTKTLSAPDNFKANTIDDSVELTWDEAPDAAKYELFFQQAGTGWQSVIVEGTKHTFTDVSPYYTYFFQIRPIDEKEYKGSFSAVNERAPTQKLPSPKNLKTNTNDNRVDVTWDAVNESNKYELFYKQAGAGWKSVFVEDTKYTLTIITVLSSKRIKKSVQTL